MTAAYTCLYPGKELFVLNRKTGRTYCALFFLLALLFCVRTPAQAANVIEKAAANSEKLGKGKLITDKAGKVRFRFSKTKEYASKTWLKVDKHYYYFDKNGYAKTGWFTYRNNTYYATSTGQVYHSKWKTYRGKTFFLQSDGTMAANRFVRIKGKIYRFTTKGVLVTTQMYTIKGNTYFSQSDGSLLVSKWLKTTSGKRYYFDENGQRVEKQWIFLKGKFYYLTASGAMAVSKKVGKYKVGEDGARIVESRKYVFVGDSRVVGMDMAISSSDTTFIGKVSMGYSWMMSTAVPQLEKLLKDDPTMYVVFCFGINDLGNIENYINAYKNLIARYKYTNFFFMSVNPVNYAISSAHGYRVTNAQIEAFNSRLSSAMSFRYLNTYTWLKKKGFETGDGIHYAAATYQKLYNYALKKMG